MPELTPHDVVRAALKKACLSEHGLNKNTRIPYSVLRGVLKDLINKGEVQQDGHRYVYLKPIIKSYP